MMTPPDLIVTWAKNVDFPVWREYILKNRHLFNQVIIVFMQPNIQPDFSEFIRKTSNGRGYNLYLDSPPVLGGKDWRDVAVNYGLMHSHNAEWVLFTEQDFFPTEEFWPSIDQNLQSIFDFFFITEGDRWHPAFLMIKRKVLNFTSRDFSASKNAEYDHFGLIQKDLDVMPVRGMKMDERLYTHMAGLSHNFRLITEGGMPVYKPKEFTEYIEKSLKVGVELHPEYVRICEEYLRKL